jgi:hypothetical protein
MSQDETTAATGSALYRAYRAAAYACCILAAFALGHERQGLQEFGRDRRHGRPNLSQTRGPLLGWINKTPIGDALFNAGMFASHTMLIVVKTIPHDGEQPGL